VLALEVLLAVPVPLEPGLAGLPWELPALCVLTWAQPQLAASPQAWMHAQASAAARVMHRQLDVVLVLTDCKVTTYVAPTCLQNIFGVVYAWVGVQPQGSSITEPASCQGLAWLARLTTLTALSYPVWVLQSTRRALALLMVHPAAAVSACKASSLLAVTRARQRVSGVLMASQHWEQAPSMTLPVEVGHVRKHHAA
jgi:hypothetical protein